MKYKLMLLAFILGTTPGCMSNPAMRNPVGEAVEVEGTWNLCSILHRVAPLIIDSYDANINPGTVYGNIERGMQNENAKAIRGRIYAKNSDGSTGKLLHNASHIRIPGAVNDEMVRIMVPMYNAVQESIRKGTDLPSDEAVLKYVRDNCRETWKPDPQGWKDE
jgi:hypothetical protein